MAAPLAGDDPRSVGAITLIGRLGEGGSSIVYEGIDPTGARVAVKVLHPELAASPQVRERLMNEAQALRAVQGERTAGVIAVDAESDQPHLVLELVHGESLDVVAARSPLTGPMLRSLAEGIVDALSDIHRAGVIHRDLKPQNIIYGADGVKVVDFGTSVLGEIVGATRTGSITGTPSWLSPEQALGAPVTAASDVFNLGMVIAFAATGSHPFGEGRPDAMIFRIVHQEPDLSALPDTLRGLVAACLDKDPERRPTLDAVARALRGLGPSSGSPRSAADVTRIDVGGTIAQGARLDAGAITLPSRALVLFGAAVIVGIALTVGLVGLLRADSGGPVLYVVNDRSTGLNPWLSEPTVEVTVGRDRASFSAATSTATLGSGPIPLEGVRWTLEEELQISYLPPFGEDESFEARFDLRELGVNRLAGGWRVIIALEVFDDQVKLSVTGPQVRGIVRSRTTFAQAELARGNEERFLRVARAETMTNRRACVRETEDRWRSTLRPYLDAFATYSEAERRRGAYDGSRQTYVTWRNRWNALSSDMSRDRANLLRVSAPPDYPAARRLEAVYLAHFRLDNAWQLLSLGTFSASSGTFGETTLVFEWNEMVEARADFRSVVDQLGRTVFTDATNLCADRFPLP